MAIVIDEVEYLTPDEACAAAGFAIEKLNSYYSKSVRGELDMPCITNPFAINAKGLNFKFGRKPNFLVPKVPFIEWLVKMTTRIR